MQVPALVTAPPDPDPSERARFSGFLVLLDYVSTSPACGHWVSYQRSYSLAKPRSIRVRCVLCVPLDEPNRLATLVSIVVRRA